MFRYLMMPTRAVCVAHLCADAQNSVLAATRAAIAGATAVELIGEDTEAAFLAI